MANLRIKDQYTNLILTNGIITTTRDTPTGKLRIGDSISQIGVKSGSLCFDSTVAATQTAGIRDKFQVPITADGTVTDINKFFAAVRSDAYFNPADDVVPDYLINYRLDGTDIGLTRVGGDDFRIAPACPEAIGSFFDGSTQYYTSSDFALLNNIQSEFTVSFWYNSLNTVVKVAFRAFGASTFQVFNQASGVLSFFMGGAGNSTTSTANIQDGNWHLITWTQLAQDTNIYIDGVFDKNFTMPTAISLSTITSLEIGSSTNTMAGGLDGFRMYDSILTPTQITALYNDTCDFEIDQITSIGHYDPSDITTTNIIEAAGLVSQLSDKSGGANHITQGIGANQMSTGLQTINGLNALSSLTSDKEMSNATFPVPTSGNISISFVAKIDGQLANNNSSLISMDNINDWQLQANTLTQFDGRLTSSGIGLSKSLTGGPFTGPDIWTMIFDYDNSFIKIYTNGIERVSTTYTTKLDTVQSLKIFTTRSGTANVFGLFGEMIIHEDVNDTLKSKNEGYLAWKWGLVASLPSTHPYKTSPPKGKDGFSDGFSDGFK